MRTQGRAPKGGRNQRDRKAVGSSSRLEARFPSRRGCQMRHFAGEWFARPQRHVPYSTLAIRSGNQYGLGFRYTQVLGRGIPLNASLELAGRIRHDHKASQSCARQFQTKIERLIEAIEYRCHLIGSRAMTLVLASLVTATAILGAWTLAILKVRRQLEDAAAIHRRLARGQDPSRL